MPSRFDDYRHLVRVAVLFLLGLAAFLVVRAWFMPPSFGRYGHYRADALVELRDRPITYAGQKACLECHGDVGETRAAGKHAKLSCEGCHGPLAAHAADPTEKAAVKPNPRDVCLRCHTKNHSRPAWFPQIVLSEHSESGPCSECHQPHKPGIS